MGRKEKKYNLFAQKKRDKKEANLAEKTDRKSEPYQEIVRENELFLKYYKHQQICPESEWDEFLKFISSDLPTTFRITACRGEAQTLLELIKSKFFTDYLKGAAELQSTTGCQFEKPMSLPWYPNEHAWQLELTRKDIRRSEAFYKLHNFLIAETSAGSISRQEAVSMIPPIVLDVKPHHKVLDMCAAPGSKTAQLIEALHADDSDATIPSGFVVANDIDNNRCYMLVHQARRLNSPCFIVTNHDGSCLPNFLMTNSSGQKEEVKFDRVLCDVLCSGDGTLRKNPDIWLKWNQGQALNLHGVQYRIARRGAELLAVGGRMVYSTCSFNPVENEAVIHRLIKDCDGALEIVDASSLVPGLKHSPGMTSWNLASKDIECFKSWEEVPEKYHTVIRPQMFPPSVKDVSKYNLEKCIRILPHHQNTGGFFVAVIQKTAHLPWEKVPKDKDVKQEIESDTNCTKKTDNSGSGEPKQKRRRMYGYKEDPYVFFQENEPVWKQLQNFYKLSEEFNPLCLLTRSVSDKKKNIYFCSEQIRDVLLCNQNSVKIINTGVKTFVRCDNKNMDCSFRLANECLPNINYMIGECRRINICKEDLILLLNNTDPTNPPRIPAMSTETQERVNNLASGSCVLKYSDEKLSISLVGWRGQNSLRAYTDANDTFHMLRLLGADLSKYDVNKFQKNKGIEEEVDMDIKLDTVAKDVKLEQLDMDVKLEQVDMDVKLEPVDKDVKLEQVDMEVKLEQVDRDIDNIKSE